MWHMMHMFIPILILAFCSLSFILCSVNIAHSAEEMWIKIPAILKNLWLAVALAPGAIWHQSPKTVCLHLCMNVRSLRARSLERLWWNPVSQFWHLISIKHKERCICADELDWKDSGILPFFFHLKMFLFLLFLRSGLIFQLGKKALIITCSALCVFLFLCKWNKNTQN